MHQHAPIRQEPVLAAEVLEPPPVVTGPAQVRVKVEAVELGLARARGGNPRCVRLGSETPHPRVGAAAERHLSDIEIEL